MVALPAPSRFEPTEESATWPPAQVRDAVSRAQRLTAAGMLEPALDADKHAVELFPDDGYLHNNLGVTLANLGRKEEALSHFEEAVKLSPTHPGFIRHMAFALTELGRARDALRALNSLRHPILTEARRVIVKYEMQRLAESGLATWSGGKPKRSRNPVKLTPGPSITELVHEGRR